jgi:2-polyprenyl-3-methyl-5-hydroxy-6-metoxy-1,4-benzoquinol methylase
MNCNICSGEKVNLKFRLDDHHSVYSCKGCGVEFMDPQLSDLELTELYSESYYASWGIAGRSENESSRQMKMATFDLRLDLAAKYLNPNTVLDIGCATGYFLEAAKKRGIEPYGIELSQYSSDICKKKFGEQRIFCGTLEESSFPPASFDLISMFDLIEHVRVPAATLGKAAELLNENGLIIITTPHNKSISNKVMGRKWTHYKKEHFYYFDLSSLEHIAEQNRLSVIYHEHSKKCLNIDYLHTQFKAYPHWLLTPVIKAVFKLCPTSLRKKNFRVGIGEITVLLKKQN